MDYRGARGLKVLTLKQFERHVIDHRVSVDEVIKVKKGITCSATCDSEGMWKVAVKGRWVPVGDTVTASEYLAVVDNNASTKGKIITKPIN